MKTYLISYDLSNPENSSDYERLTELIKSAYDWAKPLESVWLIKSELGSEEILNKIRNVTDANDKILVIEVANNWWAQLHSEVINWMRKGF